MSSLNSIIKPHSESFRYFLINILLCGFIFAAIGYVHFNKPHLYIYLVTEDWWGENGTFSCYLFSFLILMYLIITDRSKFKTGYIMIALTLGLIAMEEVSWGQRIFGYASPTVFVKYNYQSEVNLHNILMRYLPLRLIFSVFVALWVFVLPSLVSRFNRVKNFIQRWGVPLVPSYQAPFFAFAIFMFYCSIFVYVVEIGEMLFSFAFLCWAMEMFWQELEQKIRSRKIRLSIMVLLVILPVFVTNILTSVHPNFQSLQWRSLRAAAEKFPKKGYHEQALKILAYMYSDPRMWSEGSVLQYGLLLKEMGKGNSNAVLKAVLKEEHRHMKKEPLRPIHDRHMAMALRGLNKTSESAEWFQSALDKDRRRFEAATQDWERVAALTSMAKTYKELNDHEAALNSLVKARSYAGEYQRAIKDIDEGIKQNRMGRSNE